MIIPLPVKRTSIDKYHTMALLSLATSKGLLNIEDVESDGLQSKIQRFRPNDAQKKLRSFVIDLQPLFNNFYIL